MAGPSRSRYNGFLPIPITFSPTPSSSSSSSQSTKIHTTPHHLWIKPHSASKPSITSNISDVTDDLPANRTLFVANLHIDVEESDLRTVFGEYGVVERVVWKEGEMKGGGGMEDWMDEEDDEEDSEEEQEDAGGPDAVREGDASGPANKRKAHFADDPPKRHRNRKRSSARDGSNPAPKPSSTPTIVLLPSLIPRARPYMPACSSAYIVYLDALSLTRAITLGPTRPARVLSRPGTKATEPNPNPTGLEYYTTLSTLLRPPLPLLKAHADSSLALYDHHLRITQTRNSAGPIVDDDGFTLVVRGGKYGRTAGAGAAGVSVASRRFVLESRKVKAPLSMGRQIGGEGAVGAEEGQGIALDAREGGERGKARKKVLELEGFYKFQRNERKRQDLADMRSQFEQDKAKVEALKAKKRFRPY